MKQPVYFLSHGGGPWAWIPEWEDSYKALRQAMANIPQELPEKPKTILMISAHWISHGHLSIMSNPQPGMLYDYYGFPEHTYHIQYPAPGNPSLAHHIAKHLQQKGFPTVEDTQRGFDHGAFVPLAVAFPNADIPVIQLSIEGTFDPLHHIQLGETLVALREEGILIVASGMSFHNMRLFNAQGHIPSLEFDQWLHQQLIKPQEERIQALIAWEKAPSARIVHPKEDHLIPLMVAIGAAGNDNTTIHYHEDHTMGGIAVSGFKFG